MEKDAGLEGLFEGSFSGVRTERAAERGVIILRCLAKRAAAVGSGSG